MTFHIHFLMAYLDWVQYQGDTAIIVATIGLGIFIYGYSCLFSYELNDPYTDMGDVALWILKLALLCVPVTGIILISFVFLPISVAFIGTIIICHFATTWIVYRKSPWSVLMKFLNLMGRKITGEDK